MNLITDPWIPVSGRLIRPGDIVTVDGRPEWGRADLDLATYELLIGLVSVGDPPIGDSAMEQDDDWHERLMQPRPLHLDWLASYFEADQFLQEAADAPLEPPQRLLLGAPGENTATEGTTWMVKPDRNPMPLGQAIIALYAHQQYAGKGGRGYRVGMRRSGPFVTLAWPREGTLWQRVWANVGRRQMLPSDISRVFPWLAPTDAAVAPAEGGHADRPWGHPLQAFWGMPRRVRLVIDGDLVTDLARGSKGGSYTPEWRHPLTPYLQGRDGEYATTTKADFGYREWAPAVLQFPSKSVALWRDRWPDVDADVMAGGLVIDGQSGKVLSIVEAYVPLLREAANPQPLLDLADKVAFALRKAGGDAGALWRETETDFRRLLAAGDWAEWPAILTRRALVIFDRVDVLEMTPTDRRKRLDGRRSLTRKLKELTDG